MPTSVTPDYLLQGAAYALEQCGLLLRDANVLYRNGSYASAVVLAAFAHEELGQYGILIDLRKQVLTGGSLTIEDIQDHCDDHVRKQRAGMLSTVMKTDKDTVLGKLLQARHSAIGSPEWKALNEQVEELDRQKMKRTPDARHKQREAALYVDPISGGWNRPKETPQVSAYERLLDAINDYSMAYDRYTNPEIYKADDPDFYAALEEWTERPTLPCPESPPFPRA
jgi:AbiV family abortive infection protein